MTSTIFEVEQRHLDIDLIDVHPHNLRRDVGDVAALAATIKAQGMLQAVLVVPHGQDRYRLLAGHRRIAAARLAGLRQVPASIDHTMVDDDAGQLAVMLTENREREPLSAAEEAAGVQEMLDLGESVGTIAERTGWTKTRVRQRAKIATLPDQVREKLHTHQVTIGDAVFIADAANADRRRLEDAVGTTNWAVVREKVRRDNERRLEIEAQVKQAHALGVTDKYPLAEAWSVHHEGKKYVEAEHGKVSHVEVRNFGDEDVPGLAASDKTVCYYQVPASYDPGPVLIVAYVLATDADSDDDAGSPAPSPLPCSVPDCHSDRVDGSTMCQPCRDDEQASRDAAAQMRADLDAAKAVRADFLRSLPAAAVDASCGRFAALFCQESDPWLDGWPEAFLNLGGPDIDEQDVIDQCHRWLEDATPTQIAWMIAWNACQHSHAEELLSHDRRWASIGENVLELDQYLELLDRVGYRLCDVEQQLVDDYRAEAERGQE